MRLSWSNKTWYMSYAAHDLPMGSRPASGVHSCMPHGQCYKLGARAGKTTTLCVLTQVSRRLSPTLTVMGWYTWSGNIARFQVSAI